MSIQPEGSGGSGSTAILPPQQQKLLSSLYNNLAPQWRPTLINPRVIGTGLGIWCTGNSSQKLLEAPACLRALLSEVTVSRAALILSLFSLLRAARTSDGSRARAALLLALSVFLCDDALLARAALLVEVFMSHSATHMLDVLHARALLLLVVSTLRSAARSSDVLLALLLAVYSLHSACTSFLLRPAVFLLCLPAALMGAVRSYLLPDRVVMDILGKI